MYAMSLASAFSLFEKPALAVASAATGVILGWPFSILAFLPVTIYSLMRKFKQAFISGVVTSIGLMVRVVTYISIDFYGFLSAILELFILVGIWLSYVYIARGCQ